MRLSQKEKTGSGTRPWSSAFWNGGRAPPTAISGKARPCRGFHKNGWLSPGLANAAIAYFA